MSLSIGIVGLPNVGKSTLFNALTQNEVLAANYPFATIEPNVGVVGVPDARLDRLAALYDSERIVPATVTFVDIAGIVSGASEGEGLGQQVPRRHPRDRCHLPGGPGIRRPRRHPCRRSSRPGGRHRNRQHRAHPGRPADRRQPVGEARARKRGHARSSAPVLAATTTARAASSTRGRTIAAAAAAGDIDPAPLRDLQLLTRQAVHLRLQRRRGRARRRGAPPRARRRSWRRRSRSWSARRSRPSSPTLEPADAAELLAGYGQDESGLVQLVHVGFRTLGLQTFLTAGPKEARAWTIHVGATAPEAAGVIHTDFQRGFIKAEIVSFDDLVQPARCRRRARPARPGSRARTT